MRFQAEHGDVDFITGDYLAEFNLGNIAEAMAAGSHPGYEATAWDGIQQTVDLLAEKKIKLVINGGAQNPKGLALKTQELVFPGSTLHQVGPTLIVPGLETRL